MIYLAAGILLFLLLAAAGRRARQRELVASLRRNFIVEARCSLEISVPDLATVTDAELARTFDHIFAEHLRRFGARDFADLLRKGQGPEAASISTDICIEAGKGLCAGAPGCDPLLAGIALSNALTLAGPDMYAEMMPNG